MTDHKPLTAEEFGEQIFNKILIGMGQFHKLEMVEKIEKADELESLIIEALLSFSRQESAPLVEVEIKSSGNIFKIRKGMRGGRIWIENEEGEGGDFDQDEFYMHVRDFFDRRF